jgi:hypothetical protein
MREIRTSGSMSGDGKRSVAAWPKLPRPSSTLPKPPRAYATACPQLAKADVATAASDRHARGERLVGRVGRFRVNHDFGRFRTVSTRAREG